jgi:chromosome segregation ATPase
MAELDLPRSSLLTKYRDSMQELQETLVKEKKWRQDAENENRILRKRNLEIEEQVTDFRYSSVEYVAKIEDLSAENKKLSERNKDFQDHINKLEEMLDRQQLRSETLEKEVSKLEEIISDLKEELNEKLLTLEDWKTALMHFEDQVKDLENENFRTREDATAYQKAYKEQEFALEVKERELTELFQSFQLLEMENRRFKDQETWIIENQKLLEMKTQQIVEDERKAAHGFKVKLAVVNENLELAKVEKEKTDEETLKIKNELTAAAESLRVLRKSKDDLEKDLAEKIAELQESLVEEQLKLETKEKSVLSLHSELKSANEKFSSIQIEFSTLKETHSEKIREINSIKSELHQKNEVIFEVSSKNKELSSQVQTLAETIEVEKVKFSKELQKVRLKHEKDLESLKLATNNELDFELSKKSSEIHEIHEKFENLLKTKEEEVFLLNSDREKLQDIVRELDGKLRELLNKYQSEYLNWEHLQTTLKEESSSKLALENKYNSVLCRIHDLESQVESSSSTISDLKTQIKTSKKQFQADSENFLKAAQEKVDFWKQKFREEVGYLEKWAESIENDPSLTQVRRRVLNVVARLESVLDLNEV